MMIVVSTSDLIGAPLDWAVAIAEELHPLPPSSEPHSSCVVMAYPDEPVGGQGRYMYGPSRRWDFGGPIIERERIALVNSGGEWDAHVRGGYTHDEGVTGDAESTGPTPLIAAMRAFVASKLGDEVEVPVVSA